MSLVRLGGDKSEAIFAARLSRGYFCREATIHLYRTTGFGALRKGPPFHGSRSSREIKIQNLNCQMGGREVFKVIQLLLAARK